MTSSKEMGAATSADAIETAWGIIANAFDGDWSKASPEWRQAAEQWRDRHVTPPRDEARKIAPTPTP